VGLFNEKDRMDGGKGMASNWEVILTPFLICPSKKGSGRGPYIFIGSTSVDFG